MIGAASSLHFPPFRFDPRTEQLWRGLDPVELKPTATAALAFLLANPQRLVPKEELLSAVWGDTHISAATLRSVLREVRSALDDDSDAPRWIQTVHGRGYRFVGVVLADEAGASDHGPSAQHRALVGRGDELGALEDAARRAEAGERQVVFLTGEGGIGKTSLAESFFGELHDRGRFLTTYGRCIAGHGSRDSYLPILEAFERLVASPLGAALQPLLEQHAPTWVSELTNVSEEALDRVRPNVVRVDRDRMLRELATALEAITQQRPIALLLEDLHWSDSASLDAIEWLARRDEAARLLLVATFRPTADEPGGSTRLATVQGELAMHGYSREFPLAPLDADQTGEYLRGRFPGVEVHAELAQAIHVRSGGNPLIVVAYADEFVRESLLFEHEEGWRFDGMLSDLPIPQGVRQMIEYQHGRLEPKVREALEAASVAGTQLGASELAALEAVLPGAEDHLARLASGSSLMHGDADGFRFSHALHQEIAIERVPPLRRRKLHLAIAEQLETEYGAAPGRDAAVLATHFEAAGDHERAIRYLDQTAEVAMARSTHAEAEALLERALALLAALPDDAAAGERERMEFSLQAKLGTCWTITRGYVDPSVREAYGRADELSLAVADDAPGLMNVLAGLCGYFAVRGEHAIAVRVSERQVSLASRARGAYERILASLSRGIALHSVGRGEEGLRHLQEAWTLYDPDLHSPRSVPAVSDPGTQACGHGSLVLVASGRVDEALASTRESIDLAGTLGHAPSQALSHYYAMTVHQALEDVDATAASADACLALSQEHGLPFYIPAALVMSGWVDAHRGRADDGAERARAGIGLLQASGALLGMPLYCAVLAEALMLAGRDEEALEAVQQGLDVVERNGELSSAPRAYWILGELRRRAGDTGAADAYTRALEIAHQTGSPVQALAPAAALLDLGMDGGAGEPMTDGARRRLAEDLARVASTGPPAPLLARTEAAQAG